MSRGLPTFIQSGACFRISATDSAVISGSSMPHWTSRSAAIAPWEPEPVTTRTLRPLGSGQASKARAMSKSSRRSRPRMTPAWRQAPSKIASAPERLPVWLMVAFFPASVSPLL